MAKFNQALSNITGVGSGGTGVIDIEVGDRIYDTLWLQIQAAGKVLNEIVDRIEVLVDEKVQRTLYPDRYDAILKSYTPDGSDRWAVQNNVAGQTIRVPVHFYEPWRTTELDRQASAWGMADVRSFKVLVYFKVVANPTLSARSVFAVGSKPLGFITKIYDESIDITSTAKDFNGFNRADLYSEIDLFDPESADGKCKVTDVSVIWGTTRLLDDVAKEDNDAHLISREMTPTDLAYQIVFDNNGGTGEGLPMVVGGQQVKTFQVKMTLSSGTARTIRAVSQRIGPRD